MFYDDYSVFARCYVKKKTKKKKIIYKPYTQWTLNTLNVVTLRFLDYTDSYTKAFGPHTKNNLSAEKHPYTVKNCCSFYSKILQNITV